MEGRPDRLELVIHFVCGLLVTRLVCTHVLHPPWGAGTLWLVSTVAGLLALYFGDAFWVGIARLFPWRR